MYDIVRYVKPADIRYVIEESIESVEGALALSCEYDDAPFEVFISADGVERTPEEFAECMGHITAKRRKRDDLR